MHDFFNKKGWGCEQFSDADRLLNTIDSSIFDLFIIDVNLSGSNGIDLLKEVRKKNPQVPTIMISALTDIETVMDAYNEGCDEYLKKPFDLRELEVKVSKLINENILELSESVKYNLSGRILLVNGEKIHLSQKESNLFHTFMTNINQPLTHEYLESVIWGAIEDNGHALRNLVLRMRKRVGKGIIDTVQGKGYIVRMNSAK